LRADAFIGVTARSFNEKARRLALTQMAGAIYCGRLQLQAYVPAGLAIVLALGFCGLFTALAVLIGPKAVNPEKLKPFECGSEPIGTPRGRYSVRFYQVAILFLVFDIEAAFMYPWTLIFNQLSHTTGPMGQPIVSPFGFIEMLLFVAILVVALAYVWRKKAIGWE
jgi:NADH-quinone oxidoreductase subunit A